MQGWEGVTSLELVAQMMLQGTVNEVNTVQLQYIYVAGFSLG